MPAVAKAAADPTVPTWTNSRASDLCRRTAGPVPHAGNRFAFEFCGDVTWAYRLAPGEMDMHIDEGPVEHKGQVAPCIYQVDGGVFRWCPGRIGSGRRLTSFPSVDDEKYLSLVFRRAPRRARRK